MGRPISSDRIRDAVSTVMFSIQPGTHANDGEHTKKTDVDASQALNLVLRQLGLDTVRPKYLYRYKESGVDVGDGDLTARIESAISGKHYPVTQETVFRVTLDDGSFTATNITDIKKYLGYYESWRGMTHYSEGTRHEQ